MRLLSNSRAARSLAASRVFRVGAPRNRGAFAFPAVVLAFVCSGNLAAAESQWHVIASGETLYSVARAYGVSASALQAANGISDPAKLRVGQRILIPSIHRVEKGETLYGIAKAAGTTVKELQRLNGLSSSAVLRVGDILLLPSSTATAPDVAKTPDPAPKPVDGAKSDSASGAANPGAAASSGQTASTVQNPGGTSVAVKTPATPPQRAASGDMPCSGTARYLDGKVFGIAIRSKEGAPVHSVTDGVVVSAGPYRGFGSVVFVQTRSGLIYVYGGNKSLQVRVGDQVHPGQVVGLVGSDAFTGATDAYFFVFKGSKALDPASAARS